MSEKAFRLVRIIGREREHVRVQTVVTDHDGRCWEAQDQRVYAPGRALIYTIFGTGNTARCTQNRTPTDGGGEVFTAQSHILWCKSIILKDGLCESDSSDWRESHKLGQIYGEVDSNMYSYEGGLNIRFMSDNGKRGG